MEALVALAEAGTIPVIEHVRRYVNFPTNHPLHVGYAPDIERADVIVVIESQVPWIPSKKKTKAKVIQIGGDPLYRELPLRGFAADVSMGGDPVLAVRRLADRVKPRKAWTVREPRTEMDSGRLTKRMVSRIIGRVIDDDVMIFNEYNLDPEQVERTQPDGWFENSISSGLGWALGAAMGAKLAAPSKTAIACMGDGTYIFNTPLSAHQVGIPILTIVFNDGGWSTIKKAYLGSHPNGWCVQNDYFPLVHFEKNLRFDKIMEACGGAGFHVERIEDLELVLRQALDVVREENRQALVNVMCERDV
jgi:acetolactate synthase-1/2/3 large subunit